MHFKKQITNKNLQFETYFPSTVEIRKWKSNRFWRHTRLRGRSEHVTCTCKHVVVCSQLKSISITAKPPIARKWKCTWPPPPPPLVLLWNCNMFQRSTEGFIFSVHGIWFWVWVSSFARNARTAEIQEYYLWWFSYIVYQAFCKR